MRLPLYPDGAPGVVLETAAPRERVPGCTLCPLGERADLTNRCIPDEGSPGGVLLIGESPGRDEDRANRPFIGATGTYLRRLMQRLWTGPVVYANATRCAPDRESKLVKNARKLADAIGTCRGYLAGTLADARPTRIVAMGSWAAQSVLGFGLAPVSNRRAYALTRTGVPVFFTLHPTAGLRNRFLRQWFEEDLAWALTTELDAPEWDTTYSFVRVANVREATADLRAGCWVAFDTETSGAKYTPAFTLLNVGVMRNDAKHVWVWDMPALAHPVTRGALAEVMGDERVAKVGSNVQFDCTAIECGIGAVVRNLHMDVRLARKVMDTESSGKLADMAHLVGLGGHKNEMGSRIDHARAMIRAAVRTGDTSALDAFGLSRELVDAALADAPDMKPEELDRYSYGFTPPVLRARYNARDVLATARTGTLMEKRLATYPRPGVPRVWEREIRRAVPVFARIEHNGFAADPTAMRVWLDALNTALKPHLAVLKQYDINWNSTPQVSDLLYNKLGLRKSDKAKSVMATDGKTIERLAGKHKVIDALIGYRKLSTLVKMFAKPLPTHIRSDGRLHTTYLLDGTTTGRVSAHDPNLLNQPAPSRDPKEGPYWGRMARDCFVSMTAEEHGRLRGSARKCLLDMDLSQIELRDMARRSGDKRMRQVFIDGHDLHQKTAEFIGPLVWGITPEQVEKRHRASAKRTNFGLAYGQGDAQLADTITSDIKIVCTVAEARAIREAVLDAYPDLRRLMEADKAFVRKHGYAYTEWDGHPERERNLYRIADADDESRSHAERAGFNAGIQGDAAAVCIASLIELDDWLQRTGVPARIVCTVYDSITIECELSCVDEVYYVAKRIMEGWPFDGVPIVADAAVGWAWGSLRDVEDGQWPSQVLAA